MYIDGFTCTDSYQQNTVFYQQVIQVVVYKTENNTNNTLLILPALFACKQKTLFAHQFHCIFASNSNSTKTRFVHQFEEKLGMKIFEVFDEDFHYEFYRNQKFSKQNEPNSKLS